MPRPYNYCTQISERPMTVPGIITTAHALSYYQRLQEVTANNLANVSTDGFKLDRLTASTQTGNGYPTPVEKLDLSQGQIHDTGRDLDFALRGPGYFTVQTPHGERLTRSGSFHLDSEGRIVDAQGDPVTGNNGPIVVPPTGGKVTVRGDGSIFIDGTPTDQFRVTNVSDPAQLTEEGAGQFSFTGKTTPTTSATTTVQQGAIEQPNSDAVTGMIDLVSIQRAYAANLDAIKAMDGVLDTVAGQVGATTP
jgi:flagellar basal-body rod protein FlgF